ncbi:MAG: site-specific DNA-methyltransferase [Anaerococcus vaginalis]|uniref:DNA-methyltransferase n=1 Tax=Bacillota TaxID=1239 RepID=UPI00050ED230|nr:MULTISPECIES: site-specific DNA-methyltransferase [Anaerococcus]KGF33207.1 cytosine methyltransferase [Peptoniphilus lacrimalis DNF00528]MDU5087093.1 site-specific DNA-methyltransferase [Anaerococcus vaginalis]MDU6547322.1 site-specific DNA-methyltransferase [Anaerococcus vaginalis]OFL14329.1 cytosine methyltransferase [Anaerococcus sp. HMSC068A02]
MEFSKKDITNRLFEGDCIEIMKHFPDNSIDMILCDLPYGTTQNKWDSIIPLDKLWEEYRRIVKENGAIVLTSHGLFTSKLMLSNIDDFKYKWIWIKSKATNFLNAKKQPLRKFEEVCVFYKKQPAYNPQMMNGESYDKGLRKDQLSGSYGDFEPVRVKSNGERYPVDLVYFKTAESEGKVYHPTQKPVKLGKYLVRTYTNKGDLVLDNTFGSGSFLVSALEEGRNFVGIEVNEETHQFKKYKYDLIEIATKRLKESWDNLSDEYKEYVCEENLIKEFIKRESNKN